MKTLDQEFTLGEYTIVAISCTSDDADKLERLGIFQGEQIYLIKNNKKDFSVLVEHMDSNFIIDKDLAKGIEIS